MADTSSGSSPEGQPGSGVACSKNESIAAVAAAYLERGRDIIPCCRGNANELRVQSTQLVEWARATGFLIDYVPPSGARKSQGAEHEVFFDHTANRVFKKTHPGSFGSILTEKGVRRSATPYYYLRRLELIKDVFEDDIRLEGIVGGESPSIIISQPWAYPENPKAPLPTLTEIKHFMKSLGFVQVPYTLHEWFRASDGIRVSDARPDNFIKSRNGVVPIDLLIADGSLVDFSELESSYVR